MYDRPRRVGGPPHLFLGLLILALGVIFFLDQQGIFPAREAFHFFWAAVITFWGVQIVAHARSGAGHFWGGFLIVMGVLFAVNELGYLHVRIGALWPLALIAFGVWLLLGATGRIPFPPSQEWRDWGGRFRSSGRFSGGPIPPRPSTQAPESEWREWAEKVRSSFHFVGGQIPSQPPPQAPESEWHEWAEKVRSCFAGNQAAPEPSAPDSSDSEFNQSVILSVFKRRITSQHFRYGKVSAVLGGFNIDLSRADMDGDRAFVHLDSVFGGGEIRIPDTWKVKIEANAIGGGFADETYSRPTDASTPMKQLIVRGSVVFGGVVIKN